MSLALVLVLAFGAVACGGEDEADDEVTVASAESCEDLIDAVMPIMQDMLDAASEMTMEDMSSGEPPEAVADFEARMEEAGAKAEELECSDDEMGEMLADRADELTADGPVGELILEGIQDGAFE